MNGASYRDPSTPTGNAVTPVIKVSTSTPLARRLLGPAVVTIRDDFG